jgi:hypothetical protein
VHPTVKILLLYAQLLLFFVAEGGKLVFVHNLVATKNPLVAFIKPKLIHLPFIWVDFGKLTTHDEFEAFCKNNHLHVDDKEMVLNVELSEKYFFVPKALSYTMEMYCIKCSFEPPSIHSAEITDPVGELFVTSNAFAASGGQSSI